MFRFEFCRFDLDQACPEFSTPHAASGVPTLKRRAAARPRLAQAVGAGAAADQEERDAEKRCVADELDRAERQQRSDEETLSVACQARGDAAASKARSHFPDPAASAK